MYVVHDVRSSFILRLSCTMMKAGDVKVWKLRLCKTRIRIYVHVCTVT